MRWSRPLGLIVAISIGLFALASLGQLLEVLFDHGGMLPTLVLVLAFLIIVGRLGTRTPENLANPYW